MLKMGRASWGERPRGAGWGALGGLQGGGGGGGGAGVGNARKMRGAFWRGRGVSDREI